MPGYIVVVNKEETHSRVLFDDSGKQAVEFRGEDALERALSHVTWIRTTSPTTGKISYSAIICYGLAILCVAATLWSSGFFIVSLPFAFVVLILGRICASLARTETALQGVKGADRCPVQLVYRP